MYALVDLFESAKGMKACFKCTNDAERELWYDAILDEVTKLRTRAGLAAAAAASVVHAQPSVQQPSILRESIVLPPSGKGAADKSAGAAAVSGKEADGRASQSARRVSLGHMAAARAASVGEDWDKLASKTNSNVKKKLVASRLAAKRGESSDSVGEEPGAVESSSRLTIPTLYERPFAAPQHVVDRRITSPFREHTVHSGGQEAAHGSHEIVTESDPSVSSVSPDVRAALHAGRLEDLKQRYEARMNSTEGEVDTLSEHQRLSAYLQGHPLPVRVAIAPPPSGAVWTFADELQNGTEDIEVVQDRDKTAGDRVARRARTLEERGPWQVIVTGRHSSRHRCLHFIFADSSAAPTLGLSGRIAAHHVGTSIIPPDADLTREVGVQVGRPLVNYLPAIPLYPAAAPRPALVPAPIIIYHPPIVDWVPLPKRESRRAAELAKRRREEAELLWAERGCWLCLACLAISATCRPKPPGVGRKRHRCLHFISVESSTPLPQLLLFIQSVTRCHCQPTDQHCGRPSEQPALSERRDRLLFLNATTVVVPETVEYRREVDGLSASYTEDRDSHIIMLSPSLTITLIWVLCARRGRRRRRIRGRHAVALRRSRSSPALLVRHRQLDGQAAGGYVAAAAVQQEAPQGPFYIRAHPVHPAVAAAQPQPANAHPTAPMLHVIVQPVHHMHYMILPPPPVVPVLLPPPQPAMDDWMPLPAREHARKMQAYQVLMAYLLA
ncbi:unnamed protein product [Vitrella brassicaformis CCMP3155]|uniref:PH domain-containing protein n=1 Tax=Vitrella brassicaformis (strain CCMP3155) TaxID=1169540 RepID=A0A0G4FY79_VITBC|nr:unnamed protein product [Vitrella brassicaformis CCMP3155]|eukprot:CEM20397.1 unnamed protein product [Vitrella brassicaformis CCMP3155]